MGDRIIPARRVVLAMMLTIERRLELVQNRYHLRSIQFHLFAYSEVKDSFRMFAPSDRTSMLIYDLIPCVVEFCQDDYAFLFRCALVNTEFNRIASRMLYSRIVIAPQFKPVLNLRDTNPIPESSNFPSACLPRYAPYVLSLQVSGFISARPPPRNVLSEMLATAINSFVHLQSVTFTPTTYHDDLFAPSLPILCSKHTLTHLVVNQSCSDETLAPVLVQIAGLRSLTLVNPGRAILQLLPAWLERQSSTLSELHLKDNCGSVTPGVLKSFTPQVQDTVRAFTLGLSYSLSDQDTFSFLENLSKLERLNLRYYWQLRPPPRNPCLTNLRSFTATYHEKYIEEIGDIHDYGFAKWVRRAINCSPGLEELHLVCEDPDWERNFLSLVTYDGLVDSLLKKHCARLRVLDLGAAVVTLNKLREVLSTCLQLEDISISVDKSVLRVFIAKDRSSPELRCLRSVSFRLSNTPRKFNVEEYKGLLSTVMQNPRFPALRRVAINGISWEGCYALDSDSRLQFIVRRTEDMVPPWHRKTED